MDMLLQVVVNGLLLGGLFALISIGLTLIFGTVRIVNFAHGEFLMIGMYATYLMTTRLGIHPYVTAVGVIPLLFVLGVLTQKLIVERLLSARDDHIQIFATVGLSTALMNLGLLVFGADILATPPSGTRHTIMIGEIRILSGQLVILIVSILLAVGLRHFLNHTLTGRAIRAVAQNRDAARLMGVNVSRIYMLTFGIGTACVGVAAVLVAPLYPVSPTIGTYFVLTAFVVVVLGGLGSLTGAFAGAMIIGLIDSVSGFYLGSGLREMAVFVVFLLILIFRPSGLFGSAMRLSHVSP